MTQHLPSSAPTRRTRNDAPRIVVMLSGSGRTLMNLCQAIDDHQLDATIVKVIASRECLGAERARDRGLSVEVIPGQIPAHQLEQILLADRTDWVVLAGYLKFVEVPKTYVGRVVNIHPALLPAHGGPGMYGLRVHQAVLTAGDTESGCTVHVCDNAYDHGPIVLQRRCPVLPDDTAETLAQRVFAEECIAYPQALAQLFSQETNA